MEILIIMALSCVYVSVQGSSRLNAVFSHAPIAAHLTQGGRDAFDMGIPISVFLLPEHSLPSILPSPSHGLTICRRFFSPRPFSVGVRLWSLLLPSEHQRCWRGLPSHLPPRTSLHLLQTGRCKRVTVGFRRLLFYCSVLLYASSLATPPLSALLAKYLWVQRRWAKTETDPFPWTQLILDRYSKGARVIGCVDIWDLLINEALAKKFWQEDNTVARP